MENDDDFEKCWALLRPLERSVRDGPYPFTPIPTHPPLRITNNGTLRSSRDARLFEVVYVRTSGSY